MAELRVKTNDRKKECMVEVDGSPQEVLAMLLTMIHAVAEMSSFTDEEMMLMLFDIITDMEDEENVGS